MKLLATLVLAILCVSCSPSDERAIRALEAQGFTHIQLRDYPFFACSDDDKFNVAFSAVSASGVVTTGAVCCGWFKNCTVRTD